MESDGASFSVSALFESTTAENESLKSGKGEEAWLSALADGPVWAAAGGSLGGCWGVKEGLRVGVEGEVDGGAAGGVLKVEGPAPAWGQVESGAVQEYVENVSRSGGVRLARGTLEAEQQQQYQESDSTI